MRSSSSESSAAARAVPSHMHIVHNTDSLDVPVRHTDLISRHGRPVSSGLFTHAQYLAALERKERR